MLKAANFVPLTSHLLLDMLYEAGLPKGVVNMVTAEKEQAEVLLKHPAVRGVSFVGTTPVGKHVYSIAAAHGKRVQAQTQAKNHGLVLRDASLERAARGIINSTFGCAGMRCMALPVCVVENVDRRRVRRAHEEVRQERVIGAAYDPKTELGPVVSAAHQAVRPAAGSTRAIAEGAELVSTAATSRSVPGSSRAATSSARRSSTTSRPRHESAAAKRPSAPCSSSSASRTSKRASPS